MKACDGQPFCRCRAHKPPLAPPMRSAVAVDEDQAVKARMVVAALILVGIGTVVGTVAGAAGSLWLLG